MVNPYIPWDVDLFLLAILDLRNKMGVAINIGLWIFIVVTGVYIVVKIANSLGN